MPFWRNEAIPADSGTIPVDSGAIPPDSGGFRQNYQNPDGICGAPKSTAKAVSIGTANLGSLAALGGGDGSFRVPYIDHLGKPRNVMFTLQGCLYAPDAPINLLSIGALNENGLTVTFNPGALTDLSLPIDDPDLPGFTFHATVFRRLSLLNCNFIEPGDNQPSVFSAVTFPAVTPSPSLWHCRFGHIGQDADKGHNCLYMKLCDLILLSMILQLE